MWKKVDRFKIYFVSRINRSSDKLDDSYLFLEQMNERSVFRWNGEDLGGEKQRREWKQG